MQILNLWGTWSFRQSCLCDLASHSTSLLCKIFFLLTTASLSNHSVFRTTPYSQDVHFDLVFTFSIPYIAKSTLRVSALNLNSQTFSQTFMSNSIILRDNQKNFMWTPSRSFSSPSCKEVCFEWVKQSKILCRI